jgi:hypothetical protein
LRRWRERGAQEITNLTPETCAVTFSMRTVGHYHCIDWGSDWEEVKADELVDGKQNAWHPWHPYLTRR